MILEAVAVQNFGPLAWRLIQVRNRCFADPFVLWRDGFSCQSRVGERQGESSPQAHSCSEHAAIEAALRGDDASFAELVGRYESSVAAILWRFTRDRLLLEELVQDTFVETYLSLPRFRKGSPFFPWLRAIATRVGFRHWRRQRRDAAHRALLAARRPPAEPKEHSDTAEYVYRVLECLEPKDRLVLTLQYLDGCSVKEIAERMAWSVSLVKVRAFRARRKLKKLLTETEERP